MAVSRERHSIARSALLDAPVVADHIDRAPSQPRLAGLRIRLAGLIWPGELNLSSIERAVPAGGC